MGELDRREWLLTNGLGSFACGSVSDARTRTYQGWLVAALNPPGDRTLLLSHLEASLEIQGQIWGLGTNFWGDGSISPKGYELLQSFEIDSCPRWVWGEGNWQLTRRLLLPYSVHSKPFGVISYTPSRILIQYHYQGQEEAILRLRVLIGDRNFHHQQQVSADLTFSQYQQQKTLYLQALRHCQPQTPWQLRWSAGEYQADGAWYWNYFYPEENARGLNDREDLYSPGYLTVKLQPGEAVTLEASVGWLMPQVLKDSEFEQALQAEQQRSAALVTETEDSLKRQLIQAGDRFVVYRASTESPSVIAGYPWFNDWGRDTLIALPGLALSTKRFDLAKGLLDTLSRYCDHGLIPNTFPDADHPPLYNSIDAALWWIEALGLYLEATQDWDFLEAQYPTVRQIYKAFTAGTRYNICIDASDELVTWDAPRVAITWMDAVIDGEVITPRCGKPVEINALWYSALCWMVQWEQRLGRPDRGQRYAQKAKKVKGSLQKFWNARQGYFYDGILLNDHPDLKIRPNAVIALSLYHCGFPETQARQVLQVARERLLTPYGLRSLDPSDPEYQGHYGGDRLHRDRAYHQGTVWSWLIGPFLRSWRRFYPDQPIPFNSKPLLDHFQSQACFGSISEIFDGDPPHSPQGAFAQAWSVAEVLREYDQF